MFTFGAMPLYQHFLHDDAEVAIWKIEEPESFFQQHTGLVSLIKTDKRRIEYYAGRYVLSRMLPKLDLASIKVDHIGKPYLPDGSFHFSISHSYPYIAVAVHDTYSVGIDIQIFKPKILTLSSKFLHEDETELLSLDVAHTTLLWCAKEAMFKWRGTGGQDFSEQLRIKEIEMKDSKCMIQCVVIDNDFKNHSLTLMGMIQEDFTLAVGAGPFVV